MWIQFTEYPVEFIAVCVFDLEVKKLSSFYPNQGGKIELIYDDQGHPYLLLHNPEALKAK